MSYPMAYVAQENGMKLLANMAKEGIAFVHVGITTSRGFLSRHRSQAKAFVRAYARAVHYMHTNKAGFKKIITEYSKITDQGMLESSVQYAYDFVERVPLVKPQAFQVTVDQIAEKRPEARGAELDQFYDNSLVQELISDGFFKSLWGKEFNFETFSNR